MTTKTILCYGDSNTWGWNPETESRYARDERWSGVLRQDLGEGYLVIEEGLNGKEYLIPCLETHKPLDLVIIMLGTNDLKTRFSVPACDIAAGAGVLVDLVLKSETGRDGSAPLALLIAPPPLGKLSGFAEMFEGGSAKSLGLGRHYRLVAEENGCAFLDAAQAIVSSGIDGIHLDLSEHRKLGHAVASLVQDLLRT
jgi:lysophospholipase L1-like esterase